MVSYIIGKIVSLNKKSITIESNYTGYTVFVSDPTKYETGKIKKIYLFQNLSINNTKNKILEEWYGFENYNEKEIFAKLISVSAIGCKTAIAICANDVELLKTLIVNKDEEALATLKGITPKIARNIVEELTITSDNKVQNNNQVGELAKALKSLGYPNKDIENAISNIDTKKLDLSDLISDAIKYIASSCQLA